VTETATWSPLEQRIGRLLTASEQHIEVEQIDELLNLSKDLLDREIKRVQLKLARSIADGGGGRLEVTPRMLSILRTLRAHGRAHARNELYSMGYPVTETRAFAVPAQPPEPPLQPPKLRVLSDSIIEGRLRARLGALTVKVQIAATGLDLSAMSVAAIERALVDVLGARAIAADLVSPAFAAGLGETFEQHADIVDGWQYTAVNDSGTCESCAELDGSEYESWDAIQDVLPGGGPNPDCDGGDRCRCRAVPLGPGS
jgi:hypothetical protein